MGVPAFFKWITEKYPHVVTSAAETIPTVIQHTEETSNGQKQVVETVLPLDLTQPNPNAIEFDHLYLDMNGIIHPCCHPEGEQAPPTEELMIEAIFKYVDRVFALVRPRKLLYLAIDGPAPRAKQNQQRSRRFRSAKEARDNDALEENLRNELIEKGVIPPPKKSHWDSNVITPGTLFMDKVAKGLRFHIHEKMNSDAAWKNLKVILSDASVPGEGEHKIMQFIRAQRAQPGYDPNTSHVLHGLDADLIMLALGTHEPHFYILREQVFLKNELRNMQQEGDEAEKSVKRSITEQYTLKPFIFLRVPILREYLEREFQDLAYNRLPFEFDIERIIDDFVFMCFFVGNDFLPHLPSLDIRDGAIDLLFNLYRKALPTMGGYITCDGDVDLSRAQYLLQQLGYVEDRILVNKLEDQKRRDGYRKKREAEDKHRLEMLANKPDSFIALGGDRNEYVAQLHKRKEHPTDEENREAAKKLKTSLLEGEPPTKRIKLDEPVENKSEAASSSDDSKPQQHEQEKETEEKPSTISSEAVPVSTTEEKKEDETAKAQQQYFKEKLKKIIDDSKIVDEEKFPDLVQFGEHGWKSRYYQTKFGIEPTIASPEYQNIVRSYIEGLVWVFRYYYKGCTSWNWFYPYHYAPFASDLGSVPVKEVHFELGAPYKPFNQLMSVLPPDSAHALPKEYAALMTSKNSIIADFYPSNFKVDLNGKKRAWMGVALLPFIDEGRLLKAVEPLEDTLTAEERERNSLGRDILFVHVDNDLSSQLLQVVMQKKQITLRMNPRQIEGDIEYFPEYCPGDETYPVPWESKELKPVTDNCVVSVFYSAPEDVKISTKLLPGLRRGEPLLPKLFQELGYIDTGRTNRTLERLLRDVEYDRQKREGTYRGGQDDDRNRNFNANRDNRYNRDGGRDGRDFNRDSGRDNRDNKFNRDNRDNRNDRYRGGHRGGEYHARSRGSDHGADQRRYDNRSGNTRYNNSPHNERDNRSLTGPSNQTGRNPQPGPNQQLQVPGYQPQPYNPYQMNPYQQMPPQPQHQQHQQQYYPQQGYYQPTPNQQPYMMPVPQQQQQQYHYMQQPNMYAQPQLIPQQMQPIPVQQQQQQDTTATEEQEDVSKYLQ